MIDALAGLPDTFVRVAPELTTALPEEHRAPCGTCPMVTEPLAAPDPRHPRFLDPDLRCCTYHPDLPNFLVGRLLRAGGQPAELVRARIASLDGVSAAGVAPPDGWKEGYRQRWRADFGRAEDLRCPYWVGGDLACGIWTDRGATCRTYWCRHVDGADGQRVWLAAREVLRVVEHLLAQAATRSGIPPVAPAPPSRWEAWFVDCADRVDRVAAGALANHPALLRARRRLREAHEALDRDLPDVLVPTVDHLEDYGDGLRLVGYSRLDDRLVPRDLLVLLRHLDRQVPWRDALANAEAELRRPLTEAVVRDLYRARIIAAP